jgi:hypothetical protein
MFHKAAIEAAAATPGATKTELAWLINVSDQEFVPLWGIPRVSFKIVRQSGIGRAPDTRFRGLCPQWATVLSLNYLSSRIDQVNVINLIAGAGMLMGVGDFRAQKTGPWGKFKLVSRDDPEFLAITKSQGLAAQDRAIELAQPYDGEAAEILGYYDSQVQKRDAEAKPLSAKELLENASDHRNAKPRTKATSTR